MKAEQKAELAEFDETIPLEDGADANLREDESHVEQELAMLHNEVQLSLSIKFHSHILHSSKFESY